MSDKVWVGYELAKGKVFYVPEKPDEELDMLVPATSEQVVRWESARRVWEAAQAEMQELYDTASAALAAAEEAAQEAADAITEEERIVAQAEHATKEAQLDREHGPREWALLGREKKAPIIHRKTCAQGKDRQRYMRLPEAITEATRTHFVHAKGNVHAELCGRCTKPLAQAIVDAGLDLPTQPAPKWKLRNTGSGYDVIDTDGNVLGEVRQRAVLGGHRWFATPHEQAELFDRFYSRGDAVVALYNHVKGE